LIPAIIGRFLPEDTYGEQNSRLFTLVAKILESGKFKDSQSTSELLLGSAIGFSSTNE
jgi:hypothetical protein